MTRACIVPGCRNEGRNKLGVRCRVWHDGPYPHGKGKTGALWAPDAEAYLCDEHALGGARMTLFYEPDGSGATAIAVIAASHSDARSVPIRSSPTDGKPEATGWPAPVRPPSFLLLPAGGEASADHFEHTVAKALDPQVVDDSCAQEAHLIRKRIDGRLAAWGLRDNTRGFPSQARQPLIWERIEIGTMALFGNSTAYFASAQVIGKCVSDAGSTALWGSPDFRWLLFLTAVRDIDIPLEAVRTGAGFEPTYRINRQALVPKVHREDALWTRLLPYLAREAEPTREA